MALHFRPKRLLLLGFVIGSKFIPQPAFCKTACYVYLWVLIDVAAMKNYCSAVLFFLKLRSILKRNYECIEFI
jgi:hypothetical protein